MEAPGCASAKSDSSPTVPKTLLTIARHSFLLPTHRVAVGSIIALSVLGGLMGLIWPLASKYAVDSLTVASWTAFSGGVAILAFAQLGEILTSQVSIRIGARARQEVISELRAQAFTALLLTPEDVGDTGDYMVTVNSDCQVTASLIMSLLTTTSRILLTLIGATFAMLIMNPRLLLFGLLQLPLLGLIFTIQSPKLIDCSVKVRRTLEELSSFCKDRLDKRMLIRGLMGHAETVRSFRQLSDGYVAASLASTHVSANLSVMTSLIAVLSYIAVLLYGGALFLRGDATLGTVFAFASLSSRLQRPVHEAFAMKASVDSASASAIRLWKVLTSVHELLIKSQLPVREWVKRVVQELKTSRTVALTGPVGSGKSSVCRKLVWDMWTGLCEIQGSVLYVPQNACPPDCTIREFLALGMEEPVDEASLLQVLSDAELDIDTLPNGLDTAMGHTRTRLSGGEVQKLLLARAMLSKCDVLVIDEALSSIDHDTSTRLTRRLRDVVTRRGGMMLWVSHKTEDVVLMKSILRIENTRLIRQNRKAASFYGKTMHAFGHARGDRCL